MSAEPPCQFRIETVWRFGLGTMAVFLQQDVRDVVEPCNQRLPDSVRS